MTEHTNSPTSLVDDALRLLGIRRFALSVHDQSFPSHPDEEIGRGSPYSRGGLALLRFARSLGFNTVQLGPQGKTSPGDPSPYNGAIFSKSILSLAGGTLAWDPRLSEIVLETDIEQLLSGADKPVPFRETDRMDGETARAVTNGLLDTAHERFRRLRATAVSLAGLFDSFVAAQHAAAIDWFERDGIYDALTWASGTDDWRQWGAHGEGLLLLDQRLYVPGHGAADACRHRIRQLVREHAVAIERYAFGQFLLHLQHQRLREETRRLGVTLYGDMHIGCAHQDWWAWGQLFLPKYRLGAPPSRTNPDGQPWGYPVLDPQQLFALGADGKIVPGPALQFVRARASKMLADFDGLRIDHPQGLVCPWVYRADQPDPLFAVQHGARLNSAPHFPDHPDLCPFSLVRPDQLHPDPAYPRYGDEQVQTLEPEQIDRYAVLLDAVLDCARAAGRQPEDIVCEVLSTWPAPLKAVMQQRGMGRCCVTQKADAGNPRDLYRSENTAPADWIMVGSHDTKPLWLVVDQPPSPDWLRARSQLLAQRLVSEPGRREAFATQLAADPRRFCEAMFAELFLGPAQQVSVFFADLFGEKRLYHRPGFETEDSWTLRIPPDYERQYFARAAAGLAFNIPRALALALRARAGALGEQAAALADRLSQD